MEKVLNDYLEKMEKHLKPLPAADRIDIVNEIKSEMSELAASGMSGEDIVRQLGAPKALAGAYLADEINKMKKFSWKKFAMVFSFYSYASIGGLFIMPITICFAVAFFICGVLCPIAGVVKVAAHFMGYEMPWLALTFGDYVAGPFEFLGIAVVLGIILFLLGKLFWKLTTLFVKSVGKHKQAKNRMGKTY